MTKTEQSILLQNEHPKIIKYLMKMGCSYHDAEEIIQLLQEKILGGKFNVNDKNYFYLAAKHKFISFKRKRKSEILISYNSWFEEKILINDRTVDESQQFNIKEAFDKLPVKTQIALRMLYWKNKSRKEIAATLGISENDAKNVIQRGKKKIKEYLREVNE